MTTDTLSRVYWIGGSPCVGKSTGYTGGQPGRKRRTALLEVALGFPLGNPFGREVSQRFGQHAPQLQIEFHRGIGRRLLVLERANPFWRIDGTGEPLLALTLDYGNRYIFD